MKDCHEYVYGVGPVFKCATVCAGLANCRLKSSPQLREKPDFYALGIADWKKRFESLDDQIWWEVIDAYAKQYAETAEYLWTTYVTPLQSRLNTVESEKERLLSALKELSDMTLDHLGSRLREDVITFPSLNNLAVKAANAKQLIKETES